MSKSIESVLPMPSFSWIGNSQVNDADLADRIENKPNSQIRRVIRKRVEKRKAVRKARRANRRK